VGIAKEIFVFSVLYGLFNVTGAAIIKSKLLTNRIVDPQEFIVFLLDPKIMGAVLLIFISMFFSIKALSLSTFSSVIPLMTGINFMITVFIGMVFFKDQLALIGYMGILLILAGIYLIGRGYTA
jgi:multidrug transporter EmrE-like cation transporter